MNKPKPIYYGYAADNAVLGKELEGLKAVAEFIVHEGRTSDVMIVDDLDRVVITTYGFFVDKCEDKALLEELLVYLIPLQKKECEE